MVARRGALLPMALAVMVIVGLAAGAALFVARQERRASWNTRLQTTALGAADGAQADALHAVARAAPSLPVGASAIHHTPAGGEVEASSRLTRLGPTLFVLTTDAAARSAQGWFARRGSSLLLRLDPPSLGFPAAMSVIGPAPPPDGTADGTDRAPPGWPCDSTPADLPAVRHPSPAPDSATLAAVRPRAGIVLPADAVLRGVAPVVRDGACVTDDNDNWGDPDRRGPCGSWLPVIHAVGDLTVDGGVGQGLLVVDGDLSIGGGFRFSGVVITTGAIEVGPGGATLTGGVIAAGVRDASGSAAGVPVVLRSSCAIDAALIAAGALIPVADRAWTAVR